KLVVDGGRIVDYEGRLLPTTADMPIDAAVAAALADWQGQPSERPGGGLGETAGNLDGERRHLRTTDAHLGNPGADHKPGAARAVTGESSAAVRSGGGAMSTSETLRSGCPMNSAARPRGSSRRVSGGTRNSCVCRSDPMPDAASWRPSSPVSDVSCIVPFQTSCVPKKFAQGSASSSRVWWMAMMLAFFMTLAGMSGETAAKSS